MSSGIGSRTRERGKRTSACQVGPTRRGGLVVRTVHHHGKGLEEYVRITPGRDISPYLCSWRSSSKRSLATANSQALPVQSALAVRSHRPGSHSAPHTTTESSIQNPIKAQDIVSETLVSYKSLVYKMGLRHRGGKACRHGSDLQHVCERRTLAGLRRDTKHATRVIISVRGAKRKDLAPKLCRSIRRLLPRHLKSKLSSSFPSARIMNRRDDDYSNVVARAIEAGKKATQAEISRQTSDGLKWEKCLSMVSEECQQFESKYGEPSEWHDIDDKQLFEYYYNVS
jgi:hypothetical protein